MPGTSSGGGVSCSRDHQLAVLAGMALAAAALVAPAAVADPTPTPWPPRGATTPTGSSGNNSTTDSEVPVAVNTSGVLAGKNGDRDQRRCRPHVCGGRREGVLLGLQRPGSWATTAPPTRRCRWRWTPPGCWHGKTVTAIAPGTTTRVRWPTARRTAGATTQRAAGQQQHHRLDGAGGGGHLRGAGRQDGHRDHRRRTATHVRWPTARPTAGATTTAGSSATTAPPTRWCRWRWTPPGRWPARRSPRSPPGTTTRVRWPTGRRTAGAATTRAVGQQQHH